MRTSTRHTGITARLIAETIIILIGLAFLANALARVELGAWFYLYPPGLFFQGFFIKVYASLLALICTNLD
jgi:hypothetical protein